MRRAAGVGTAETAVLAVLECGSVPVRIVGNTLGVGPDAFSYTIWGERASYSARSLYQLYSTDGGAWQPFGEQAADPAALWFRRQLDNIADWATGDTHTMPNFADAFAVQQVIEQMLRRDNVSII